MSGLWEKFRLSLIEAHDACVHDTHDGEAALTLLDEDGQPIATATFNHEQLGILIDALSRKRFAMAQKPAAFLQIAGHA
jgi:uncharacterized protein VirK/YbjX